MALNHFRQPSNVPNLDLNAAIVANQEYFLRKAPKQVTFPGTCNSMRQWEMGDPPLVVNTIQCVLSNAT
ncbi:unnamed protein product [Anisakis simplex]|uniref:MH2 domain-containing protein n=1 Tax=Anisakis simplex TaxID=6269 RepID=A0A0M3JBY2_ANISI|nr:unnamed protein product [Anisakis simplex]